MLRLLAAILGLLLAALADPPPVRAGAESGSPAWQRAATAYQKRRAAWLWEHRIWRTRAADLLDRAQQLKIDTLFIALDIRDGSVRYRTELRQFLTAAHARNISVLAVEGDPHMVLPEGQPHAIARAKAIRDYQLSVLSHERLDGLQYDIEPYTLPGFNTNDPNDLRKWSDTYRLLRQAFAQKLDIVLPFWIANKPAGANFVRRVAAHATSLATMAYRTQKDRIIGAGMPIVQLGTQLDVPVRVALENGPTEEGPGVSFEGDLPALLEAMRQTLPTFAQQDSFAGFAIHGIVWPGQEPP